MTPDDCVHLTVADVAEIHAAVIEAFGGASGTRDQRPLEPAVAAPQATAIGRSPFASLHEVAAAYLFYLCRNHPFVADNKHVAMAAAIVFLRLNGIDPPPVGAAWYALVMDAASSRIDREETALRLRELVA